MSAGPHAPQSDPAPSVGSSALLRWLASGAAGSALLFVASSHLPETFRPAGLLPIALGAVTGWGLGQWAAVLQTRSNAVVALAAGAIIAAGQVLAASETHRDGVKKMRASKAWQEPIDPISAKFKEFLQQERDDESPENRQKRLEILENVERGEAMHRERMEYLTFRGYLSSRIPKEWGKWKSPWPFLFWGTEVLLSSVLGGWLALRTLRGAQPAAPGGAHESHPEHQVQGDRG